MSGSRDPGGFYCYLATPFDAAGAVDTGLIPDYVDEMIRAGVDGVTCVASTCEGPYLSDDERRTLIASVGAAVAGRTGLNVGVSAVSTKQVIENAKHAQDHGATCLMIEMQQYFPITAAGIYRHYAEIAEAVTLPIRLYNLPVPTRVDLTPSTICKLGSIAAIRSVKDASGEVERLQQIREACGDRFTLYCGLHFQLLEGMRMGADGWEVMLHPLIAPDLVRLFRTVSAAPDSSASAAHFARWLPVFRFFRQHGVPQSIKALSRRTPMQLGSMRRPQTDLSAALQDEVWTLTREALG